MEFSFEENNHTIFTQELKSRFDVVGDKMFSRSQL